MNSIAPSMRLVTRVMTAICFGATATLATVGCSTESMSTDPKGDSVVLIVQTEMTCPITGESVTELDEVAFFECYAVHCKGRDSARQFAALEMKQRARLGAEQVLAQKGISNAICPLSGDTLTAAAAPVTYEGEVIGFSSPADANQFRALPREKQSKLVTQWKAEEAAIEDAAVETAEGED